MGYYVSFHNQFDTMNWTQWNVRTIEWPLMCYDSMILLPLFPSDPTLINLSQFAPSRIMLNVSQSHKYLLTVTCETVWCNRVAAIHNACFLTNLALTSLKKNKCYLIMLWPCTVTGYRNGLYPLKTLAITGFEPLFVGDSWKISSLERTERNCHGREGKRTQVCTMHSI